MRPDLGTRDDLRDLATLLRGSGISLVVDLVLNHVAREHDWAVRARAGDPAYRDYFHVFADRALPDAYEQTLPEVFPDFAPGNFTWDDDLAGWVWTTFNAWQWDLNWANPDVLVEFADIVLDLANLGVEVLPPRRDRVPLEAARAPTARTSPRCTRSPRRCGRWPGSRRPRSRSRPRRSSGRATWCSTSASARTPAGSATSPTTTR